MSLPPGVGPVRVVRQFAAVSGLGRDAVETRDVLGIGTVEALVVTRFCELGPKRFFVAGRANDAGDDVEPVRWRKTQTSDLNFCCLRAQREEFTLGSVCLEGLSVDKAELFKNFCVGHGLPNPSGFGQRRKCKR